MGRNYDAVSDYQKCPSIQASILWELSIALKHNFFADIAAQMPEDFSTDAPVDTSKDVRIAALEEAPLKVTAERDVLLRVVTKG